MAKYRRLLSVKAQKALEDLLKNDPALLLKHRNNILLGDPAQAVVALINGMEKTEVRAAMHRAASMGRRYTTAIRKTRRLPPDVQAGILVAFLLSPESLMKIKDWRRGYKDVPKFD